jgi:hypothetical protein
MVCKNHGGLPTAALHGGSPPPYTFDTCDLNFLPKIWSKSMVCSPDTFEDALKRPITIIPPSITTTHHDGGLSSPLSYTLADDNPPLPSTPIQRLRQNLRERRQFQNNGWTKWEAVQLADELEATQEMVKADWECWKKLEERFKQIHGTFLSDLDEDDQDKAHRDERIRLRWNVELSQHAQEMDMSSHFLSLPPNSRGLPHQELCSKETEKDEEQKSREIHKLRRGKR